MPRNLLLFIASLFASALSLVTAASAADYAVEQETGYVVGAEQPVVVVEEEDKLVDINIDLGLFDDDDEDEVVMRHGMERPAPDAPFFPE